MKAFDSLKEEKKCTLGLYISLVIFNTIEMWQWISEIGGKHSKSNTDIRPSPLWNHTENNLLKSCTKVTKEGLWLSDFKQWPTHLSLKQRLCASVEITRSQTMTSVFIEQQRTSCLWANNKTSWVTQGSQLINNFETNLVLNNNI